MPLRSTLAVVALALCTVPASAATVAAPADRVAMHRFVDRLMARMTVPEKIGQLTILGADHADLERLIRQGRVGGTNGVLPGRDVRAYTRRMQQLAMQSRLKIPLWFMGDVNHGFRTIFPVPLALASSWDTDLVTRVHRAAASEATAAGVDWTFSPMVDITRDPRWGRVVEGAGEDPFLGAAMARAQVHGFQGRNLAAADTMMATVKHFAGYGAARAGRDYNPAYIPAGQLHNVYLPPFRAAVAAGVGAVMPSLTTLNDVPATADRALLLGTLRRDWRFRGLVVSDFDAVPELQQHGIAGNAAQAARLALAAGVDIDLHSGTYMAQLPALVRSGQVSMQALDAAVRRVLDAKYRLGLFRDPFRYDHAARQKRLTLSPAHRALARKAAIESMVLLKNTRGLLPLSPGRSIAVIGPLATAQRVLLGQMPAEGRPQDVVPILDGIRAAAGKGAQVRFVRGVPVTGADTTGMDEAVRAARSADVAVLVLGEDSSLFGEGLSRSHIGLPGRQLALAKAVIDTGTPTVVVLVNGRPLAIPWLASHAGAILEAWVPGDEGGNAVADLLFGRADPSGRLPMTFPRDVGQVPLYYAHRRTGRPFDPTNALTRHYSSHYMDVANAPLYPFGFGLAYTRFRFGPVHLDRTTLRPGGRLQVSVRVRNVGARGGTEVVQLYVQQKVASVSPPLRLLRGFRRVWLAPGASRRVRFTLAPAALGFWHVNGDRFAEPGEFRVYVGADSTTRRHATFRLSAAR